MIYHAKEESGIVLNATRCLGEHCLLRVFGNGQMNQAHFGLSVMEVTVGKSQKLSADYADFRRFSESEILSLPLQSAEICVICGPHSVSAFTFASRLIR